LTCGHQYLETLAIIDGFSAFNDHPLEKKMQVIHAAAVEEWIELLLAS
jgi:hypothetical protein